MISFYGGVMQELNNLNQNETKLFKKLIARFHNSKIVQKLTGLIVTSSLLLSLASCDSNNYDSGNSNDNPNDNTSNVGNNTNNNNGNTNDNTIDMSQYSQLLQNVLNNEYYDSLLIRTEISGEYDLYETGDFKPHPYAFLEDEGFDVESIKNGELDAYTMSYVLDEEPNNLYLYTRVADKTNTYYNTYLLKYELTDQEMDDYQLMHAANDGNARYFLQSVFMNNEISKIKTPEIIQNLKITFEALNGMDKYFTNRSFIETNHCIPMPIIKNPKEYDYSIIIVQKDINEQVMLFNDDIITLQVYDMISMKNDIYRSPYSNFLIEAQEALSAKVYLSQDANLKYRKCLNFETYDK